MRNLRASHKHWKVCILKKCPLCFPLYSSWLFLFLLKGILTVSKSRQANYAELKRTHTHNHNEINSHQKQQQKTIFVPTCTVKTTSNNLHLCYYTHYKFKQMTQKQTHPLHVHLSLTSMPPVADWCSGVFTGDRFTIHQHLGQHYTYHHSIQQPQEHLGEQPRGYCLHPAWTRVVAATMKYASPFSFPA